MRKSPTLSGCQLWGGHREWGIIPFYSFRLGSLPFIFSLLFWEFSTYILNTVINLQRLMLSPFKFGWLPDGVDGDAVYFVSVHIVHRTVYPGFSVYWSPEPLTVGLLIYNVSRTICLKEGGHHWTVSYPMTKYPHANARDTALKIVKHACNGLHLYNYQMWCTSVWFGHSVSQLNIEKFAENVQQIIDI